MPDSMKARVASLSPRQREIVRLTSLGCTSHEIATILGMSRWTVENHQFQAKERLGVSKAAVLTRIAIKYKISPLDDALSQLLAVLAPYRDDIIATIRSLELDAHFGLHVQMTGDRAPAGYWSPVNIKTIALYGASLEADITVSPAP